MPQFPKHILLELTPKCNFRCPFCYCVWHEYPELCYPELDTAGWYDVIERIVKLGASNITFTGGEPLLRNDLFDIIDFTRAKAPNARLSVFTNGSLMTEELILAFKQRKVHLSTSLQGLRTYGTMTGTRRTFKRQLKLIARAAELKWPFAVSITATSVNKHELSDMIAAAALSGASTIQIGAVMAEGRCKQHIDLMLTAAEWKSIKSELFAIPNLKIPLMFVDELICTCRTQPEELKKRFAPPRPAKCSAGKSFCVVGPNGTIRKCLHTIDTISWP